MCYVHNCRCTDQDDDKDDIVKVFCDACTMCVPFYSSTLSNYVINNARYEMVYGLCVRYKGSYKKGKRHGKGTSYFYGSYPFNGSYPSTELGKMRTQLKRYEGEWQNGRRHGRGTSYYYCGVLRAKGIWSEGKLVVDELWNKRERDAIEATHSKLAKERIGSVGEVPACAICHERLHHGDGSWAYIPCGHRVLCDECGDPSKLQSQWKTKCLVCKSIDGNGNAVPTTLNRIF